MPKNPTTVEAPAETRSHEINLSANEGRAALAAWQMLYHLFGARVKSWKIVGTEGVEATGFSTFADYDPETIVKDISSRTRRLELLTTYPWLMGEIPDHFTDAADITASTVQFYKGSVEDGSAKTPPYVKPAVANYKAANKLAKKRGPKAKVIRLDNLDSLDEAAFENIPKEDLAVLQATLERVMQVKANNHVEQPVEAAAI